MDLPWPSFSNKIYARDAVRVHRQTNLDPEGSALNGCHSPEEQFLAMCASACSIETCVTIGKHLVCRRHLLLPV